MRNYEVGLLVRTDIGEEGLAALIEKRRQVQIEVVTRELMTLLENHNATLQTVCGFSADGRHVSEIRVVLRP